MPRSYGRVLSSIWDDADFLALAEESRMMYLFLISQPDLDQAGVIALRPRRWAKALKVSAEDVETRLAALKAARFTVSDDDTEELLIRSLIRRDDVWRQPNVFKAGAAAAVACKSARLKAVLLGEIRRLDISRANAECKRIAAELAAALEPFANPSGSLAEPFVKGSQEPPENPSGNPRGKEIGRSPLTGVINHLPVADARANPDDDDGSITHVVEALAERAGRPVEHDEAREVITIVLDRAKAAGKPVHHTIPYVLRAIKAEHDVYGLLLEGRLAAIEAEDTRPPPHCGDCDPATRQLDRYGDNPRRCPDCHPETTRRTA